MRCYSGQKYNIVPRLIREERQTELTCIQFQTIEAIKGQKGWAPLTKEEFWPIYPAVGDRFIMESYWDGEEENIKPKYITWQVIRRDILFSGPNATEMNGIVILTVKEISEKDLEKEVRDGDTGQ